MGLHSGDDCPTHARSFDSARVIDLAGEQTPRRKPNSRFLRRVWQLRSLGLVLGALPIVAVLHERAAPAWLWACLAIYVVGWPQLALWLTCHSREPRAAETRNFMIDSAFGGAWIAAMGFNLVPSALIASVLAVDKINMGGWRLLRRCLAAQILSLLTVGALLGFEVALDTSTTVVLWSMPLILLYPLATSAATYQLSRKVRKQNQQLERLNRIDVLTGLPNRRHWEEVAAAELARYLRVRRPASVMLIDVDNFKQVNDRFGHAVGDEVLRCLAQALRASIREIDTAVRHGGDEFAVLLAETDPRGALAAAERVRSSFTGMCGQISASVECTLSIGVADAGPGITSVDDWVRRADAAMYRAKSAGRDQVEAFPNGA